MNSKYVSKSALPQVQSKAAQRPLASFGRRRGRRLRVGKQVLMDGLLPALTFQPPLKAGQEHWLEVGFGGGEHLAHIAKLYPQVGIIGCEPYINGIGDLLKKIDAEKINNIRIWPDDARLLMQSLPVASISRLFILYPDPWPKTRHHKRRLVSRAMLDELARVMKSGAELKLATDHHDYCTWMFERLLAHPDFKWQAKSCNDWLSPWPDYTPTRYEQKALAGRPTYLVFKRL